MDYIPHILVIDDDLRLRNLLAKYLKENGFMTSSVESSEDADKLLHFMHFDLLVLDIMLPGQSGLEFISSFRKWSDTPVLLLTAKEDPEDRIQGLELGADDYLSKPFEPRELVLRVHNILKRKKEPVEKSFEKISFGNFSYDIASECLMQNDQLIPLTSGEQKLLTFLAKNAGNPQTREALTRYCDVAGNVRSIDVQITRLRKKIEKNPKNPFFLKTVRGKGYVLYANI